MIRRLGPALYLALLVAPVMAQAALAAGPWNARQSVAGAATLAALVVVTIAAGIRAVPRVALLGATAVAALSVIALSGALVGALVATAIVLSAFVVGSALLRLLLGDGPGPAERTLFAVALGLGAIGYAVLALALVGLLVVPLGVVLLAPAVALVPRIARAVRPGAWSPPRGAASAILGAGCVWALVLLVEAVAPEVQYDALSYHLGLPRVWIDAGRMVDVPEQIQSYYYLSTEMQYALAMLVAGPIAAKLLSFGYLAMTVAAVYVVARRLFGPTVGAIAAALFGATPAVAWQGTTTYVDVAVCLYVFLGSVAALHARAEASLRSALLASILLGLAVAAKVTAALTVAPVLLFIVLGVPVVRRPAAALAVLAAFAVAFGPWPLLRFAQTGDPVFPLFNGIFQSPLWSGDVVSDPAYDLARFVRRDVAGLVSWPLGLSYLAERYDDGAVGAGFGLALLLAPVALARWRTSNEVRAFAVFAGVCLVAWSATLQYARYVMPVLAPLSILAAVGLAGLSASPHRPTARLARAIPPLLMVTGFAALLFLYPYVPDRIPYAVALGIESPDRYLSRTLPSYDALRAAARNEGRDSYVLLLSFHAGSADDEDRLYAPGRVETIASPWTQALVRIEDPDRALAAIRDRGITHVYVDRAIVPPAIAGATVLQPAFLERAGPLEYRRGPVELRRVR